MSIKEKSNLERRKKKAGTISEIDRRRKDEGNTEIKRVKINANGLNIKAKRVHEE
jgi:hypothetical protein